MALIPWVGRSAKVRIAVVGDLMLDEYLAGEVNRISPEAPVPVHLVSRTTVVPGGAANAARNIQRSGGQALVFGVVGDDQTGTALLDLLHQDQIDCSSVRRDKRHTTIKKTRITSGNHQLLRIDWEKSVPISEDLQQHIIAALEATHFDGILVSDYGKGALPSKFIKAVIDLAKSRKIPCVVDPKGRDFSKYVGAHTVKPNRKEALESMGRDPGEWVVAADLVDQLRKHWGLDNVLITLGSQGMIFDGPQAGGQPIHLPSEAREVFDVSGAGDCVAAVYTMAVASGSSVADAMRLANAAAGVVVQRWGTHAVTLAEIEGAFASKPPSGSSAPFPESSRKIVTAHQLLSIVGSGNQRKRRMVFTNGCFDILHAGHATYLEAARALGDLLVVGINSDQSISRIKGPKRPIVEEHLRMRTIAALGAVDFVVLFDEDTPIELIHKLTPNVLVKGSDWSLDTIAGGDYVRQAGGEVKTIDLVPGISTTEIINRILRKG